MAGRYINTTFWKDSYVVDLEADEKLLFLYLLTNPLTNIAGIYEISIREIAFDTNMEKRRVEEILAKFIKDEKIEYTRGWLALNNWIKHQSQNPKVVTGIQRIMENLPDWLQKHLLEPEDAQSSLLEDRQPIGNNTQSKPIALNLTKLNLTKLNASPANENSKELSKAHKRQYAIAMEKEREQEVRAKKRFERKASKPTQAIDVDEIYKRREMKR